MANKRKTRRPKRKAIPRHPAPPPIAIIPEKQRWTATQFRIVFSNISFLGTLLLAGIAIGFRVTDPTIWAFLGMAVSAALGSRLSTS